MKRKSQNWMEAVAIIAAIAVKTHAEADIKLFWSSSISLDISDVVYSNARKLGLVNQQYLINLLFLSTDNE